ncbi:MAG: hypothetical protein Q7S98_06655 [Deltaproteobacteria bacterium]|nr:hypothetical protein [Deltaproteobacteria bacterium]
MGITATPSIQDSRLAEILANASPADAAQIRGVAAADPKAVQALLDSYGANATPYILSHAGGMRIENSYAARIHRGFDPVKRDVLAALSKFRPGDPTYDNRGADETAIESAIRPGVLKDLGV